MGAHVYVCVAVVVIVGVAVVVVSGVVCVHAITEVQGSAVGHDICGKGQKGMTKVTDWGHRVQSGYHVGKVATGNKHKNNTCNK